MIIQNRTEEQKATQQRIIKELAQRPQMPIGILAGIIGCSEYDTQVFVDDLEYRGSIVKRVSPNFLTESECITIQRIQDEIAKRLGQDKIDRIPVSELERMLEKSMERKRMLDTMQRPKQQQGGDAKTYLDKLLNDQKDGPQE